MGPILPVASRDAAPGAPLPPAGADSRPPRPPDLLEPSALRRARTWPLLLLALGLGVLIERLVVTDTEAIEALLGEAFAAAQARDLTRIRPLLSDDFDHQGRGPDAALAEAQRLLDRHKPTLLELRRGPIVAAAPNAEAEVDVRALAYGGGWIGRLVLRLRKEPGGWRVLSADDLPLPATPLGLPNPGGR